MEKKVYKIQDLLKEEFIGKVFKITNVNNVLDENINFWVMYGDDCSLELVNIYCKPIHSLYHLNDFLNMEFELVEDSKQKTKGYLANGLFSLGDRLVNELLAEEIRDSIDVDLYNPQENQALNNKQAYADSGQIYEGDYDYLKETDFLVAVIDGCEIDSGTAAEIAIVSTMDKPIYALYTDNRQQGTENQKKIEALVNDPTENQFMYRNLFVIGLIKKHGYIFNNIEDLVKQLKEDINK